MKKSTQLLTALVFCSLMIFISCKKGKDEPENDPRDAQAEKLTDKTWTVTEATFEGSPRPDWQGATVTFSYNKDTDTGTYTVSGVPTTEEGDNAAVVLGTGSVTWSFESKEQTGVIIRGDGVDMDVQVTDTTLKLTFDITGTGSRIAGFDGTWVFNFSAS